MGLDKEISIHALREEGDFENWMATAGEQISIHALREEGDHLCQPFIQIRKDFYPRPPRGGRPSRLPQTYTEYIFLSTPSARRATSKALCKTLSKAISIHALREEGDNSLPFRAYAKV